jgi:hypothetical protein
LKSATPTEPKIIIIFVAPTVALCLPNSIFFLLVVFKRLLMDLRQQTMQETNQDARKQKGMCDTR